MKGRNLNYAKCPKAMHVVNIVIFKTLDCFHCCQVEAGLTDLPASLSVIDRPREPRASFVDASTTVDHVINLLQRLVPQLPYAVSEAAYRASTIMATKPELAAGLTGRSDPLKSRSLKSWG